MSGSTLTAFLSHATEDKDRFVLGLAERLRAKGVDVWLDKWEMVPGDSLVDKIFEEGIGGADVFLIVLSMNSVGKPWVREELNAAVVRRIEGNCRVIPVVLDDVEVPGAVKATLWQKIYDPDAYDEEFEALLRGILGVTAAPPLGSLPAYALNPELPGLSRLDSAVLTGLCEAALARQDRMVQGDAVRQVCSDNDLTPDALTESLHALDRLGLIDEARVGAALVYARVSWRGLGVFLEATRPGIGEVQRELVAHIVNTADSRVDIADLAERVGESSLVVEAVLVPYESAELLRIARFMGGRTEIRSVSPLLRRELD